MNELTQKVRKWAIERNLDNADHNKQILKLGEEYGELCQGIVKNNEEQVIDSIGDMFVVLTILAMQLNVDIQYCVQKAYNEIKERKGKMVNGVFIKEDDLK